MKAAGDPVATAAGGDPVATAIDGATSDWTVSGDAMRWRPEGARWDERPGPGTAVGLGAGPGLDLEPVRRLVTDALTALGAVAGGVVAELRQVTRGAFPDDATPPEGDR